MPIANAAVDTVARITRLLPGFRGLGTGYRLFNRMMLGLGAEPVVVAHMKNGTVMRVDLRSTTDIDAYYRGEYDPELLSTILQLLEPGKSFLDVGANIGFYAVAVAAHLRQAGGGGRVLAFEPVSSNFRRLDENLRANACERHASLFQVGLSSESGEAAITLREDFVQGSQTGNAAITTSPDFDRGFSVERIRLETLDGLWGTESRESERIGVVKVDIEGHEDHFLKGARKTLAAHRPTILLEVNKPYFRSRGVELDPAFNHHLPDGYRTFRRVGGKWAAIESFDECAELDNVASVPAERLAEPRFAAFTASRRS